MDAIAINVGIGVGGPFLENELQREIDLINLSVVSVGHLAKRVIKDTGTALQPGTTATKFLHRAGMDDTKVGADKKGDSADVAKTGFEVLVKNKDHVGRNDEGEDSGRVRPGDAGKDQGRAAPEDFRAGVG